jgi:hypothetical protein
MRRDADASVVASWVLLDVRPRRLSSTRSVPSQGRFTSYERHIMC